MQRCRKALGSLMSPWHGKDPDAQTPCRSQDQIPAAGPSPRQQRLAGAGSQRQQSLLSLNHKPHPGRDERLSSAGSEQKTNWQTPAIWGRGEERLRQRA